MTTEELYREIAAKYPDARVYVTTGVQERDNGILLVSWAVLVTPSGVPTFYAFGATPEECIASLEEQIGSKEVKEV